MVAKLSIPKSIPTILFGLLFPSTKPSFPILSFSFVLGNCRYLLSFILHIWLVNVATFLPFFSKGKEFTVVFTTISKFKTDKNIKAMEEERRTLFVSLTRAKEKLFITHQEYDGNTMNRYKNKFAEELADTKKCKVFVK